MPDYGEYSLPQNPVISEQAAAGQWQQAQAVANAAAYVQQEDGPRVRYVVNHAEREGRASKHRAVGARRVPWVWYAAAAVGGLALGVGGPSVIKTVFEGLANEIAREGAQRAFRRSGLPGPRKEIPNA